MRAGSVLSGRFEIEAAAGVGGMGEVFRAHDRASNGPAAVKVLRANNAELLARFDQEAHTLARLVHPAIVRYLGHGIADDGSPYLAMEWLEGEDLAERLERGPLDAEEAVTLTRLVAEALGFAHDAGVVHRDVKPSNVFLERGDTSSIKLLDFGIARGFSEGRRSTRTGVGMGTPGYMAPEQVKAARDVDARADVFSLGCVLYECLVGMAAFQGDNALAILAKILLSDPPRLLEARPDLSGELDALLAVLLAKDRTSRPANGREVALALTSIASVVRDTDARPPARETGLTHNEQRLVSVVAMAGSSAAETDATLLPSEIANERTVLSQGMSAPGPRLERLRDGTLLAVYAGQTAASDLVLQAARHALSLRTRNVDGVIAVATGRGVMGRMGAAGDAIDRVALLLDGARRAPGIFVDDATRGLLDGRFDLREIDGRIGLFGERETEEGARVLVGKATPCVGRERELATLLGIIDESAAEPCARAVVVLADPGIGKSRLRQELLGKVSARNDGTQILRSEGDAVSAGSTLGIIANLLRSATGLHAGRTEGERRLAFESAIRAKVDPDKAERVATFLGELVGAMTPDADNPPLRAARLNPRLMADQIHFAWLDFVMACAAKGPVLIVVENLHWGDAASLRFLETALDRCRDAPVTVLALGRPETRDVFPALFSTQAPIEILLRGISHRAGERLVKIVLGDEVASTTIARLLDAAGGNPLYLEELLRAEARQPNANAMPASLTATLEGRLEALDPRLRLVLRAASIFGETFWRGGIAYLTRLSETDVGYALDELARNEVIAPRASSRFHGEYEYHFRHALLRDAAAAMLTDEDRLLGNRLGGEWLDRAGETDAGLLAGYFARGDQPHAAAPYWLRAAMVALARAALDDAFELAERALADCRDDVEGTEHRGVALSCLADAQRSRGNLQEAVTLATEALALLDRGSAAWCDAARILLQAVGVQGDVDAMRSIAASVLAVEADGLATEHWLRPAASAAYATEVSFPGESRTEIFEAIDRVLGSFPPRDPLMHGDLALAKGARAIVEQRFSDSLALGRAAADAFLEAGAHRRFGPALNQHANSLARIGQWSAAFDGFTTMLDHAVEFGLRVDAAVAKANRASVRLALGDVEAARTDAADALEEFEREGSARLSTFARISLAGCALADGDAEGAVTLAEAARAATQGDLMRAYAGARLAQALVAAGRPAEARQSAEIALAAIRPGTDLEDNMGATLRLAHAEALHALGDTDGARAAIAIARDRLLAQAQKLDRDEWRESFLHCVPQHSRILGRWGEWIGEAS